MYKQALWYFIYILMCDVVTSLPTMKNTRLKHETYLHDSIPCEYKQNMKQIIVDCSGRSLNYTNKFWFPENTTEIMLQHNVLTVVKSNTLNNFYKLERLSLQDNFLTYIEPGAFQGLINLYYLNLEHNKMDLFSLPVAIFSDIINLSKLLIMQKERYDIIPKTKETFPDKMFGNLTNLTHLSISTIQYDDFYFNKEFNNLRKLSSLIVAGPFGEIASNSFENVRFVQNLYVLHTSSLGGMLVSHDALMPFHNLSNITYSMTPIGLREAIQTLRPLHNKNLTYLRFHQVKHPEELKIFNYKDGILTFSMEVLEHICIENLILENNDLLIIDFGWYLNTKLKKCLKNLIIFDNIILDYSSIYSLQYLTVLENIIINGITFTGKLEYDQDPRALLLKGVLSKRKNRKLNKHNIHSIDEQKLNVAYCKLNGTIIDLPLFYSVENISLSSFLVSPITVVLIYSSESLLELSLTHLNLVEICFKPNDKQSIEGLPNLRLLDISFNDLSKLYPEFFDKFPSLEILYLQNSLLISTFISENSFRLFQNLTNLQSLDISYNSLDILSPKTFQPNPRLTSLNISLNRFKNIPFDLKITQKLQTLDLRQNVITTLSKKERDQIERNMENLGHFELYFAGNILSCGCDNLQFLQWLQMTNVKINNDGNFTCMNQEGVLCFTSDYSDIEELWRECSGQFYLSIAIGLISFNIIAFVLFFLWTKNKVFILSTVLQVFTGFKLAKISDYKYNVFLEYSEDFQNFSCNILKKCIEEDLKLQVWVPYLQLGVGQHKAEGILEAINSSWRVILVVNEDIIDGETCIYYTFKSAIYSISPVNPSRVIILVEKKCLNTLPTELFRELPEDNIIVISDFKTLLSKKELPNELKQCLRIRLM